MVGQGTISDVTEPELVKLMVGRDVSQIFPERAHAAGDEILEVSAYNHPTEFADIGFTLRRGEILGFYGLVGAGRSEFMQALFGITRPSGGTARIDGKTVSIRSPADAVESGIVYVPEDRGKQGAIGALPIFQNVTLPSLSRTSRKGFIKLAEEFKLARDYVERLDLRAASLDTNVGNLSGGNQQKVVIAKWLATQPKIIILDEPTKGIDIGSKAAVGTNSWRNLPHRALPSSWSVQEIPEIMGMSDPRDRHARRSHCCRAGPQRDHAGKTCGPCRRGKGGLTDETCPRITRIVVAHRNRAGLGNHRQPFSGVYFAL